MQVSGIADLVALQSGIIIAFIDATYDAFGEGFTLTGCLGKSDIFELDLTRKNVVFWPAAMLK